jgi:hypothetical protein
VNRIVNAPILNATIWNPMSDITSSPVAKIRRREQKDVSQSPMEAERVAVMAKISLCQVRHHAEQPRSTPLNVDVITPELLHHPAECRMLPACSP